MSAAGSIPKRHGEAYLVLVVDKQLLPCLGALGELERRKQVGVLEREAELALVLARALLKSVQDILRHSIKLFLGEPDVAALLVEVLLELNGNLAEALLDLLEAVPLLARGKA